MLGELIAEKVGKVIGRRVVETEQGPQIETSEEYEATLLGVPGRAVATYRASVQPDGSLRAKGGGIFMGQRGEQAVFSAEAVGWFNDDGSTSFRGCAFYSSQSETLRRLNRVVAPFEHEVDAEGNSRGALYEWR